VDTDLIRDIMNQKSMAEEDRIQMTDNVKITFEVETLINSPPATVSHAGIIYASDTYIDWSLVIEALDTAPNMDQRYVEN
jgi:hypothetical protein